MKFDRNFDPRSGMREDLLEMEWIRENPRKYAIECFVNTWCWRFLTIGKRLLSVGSRTLFHVGFWLLCGILLYILVMAAVFLTRMALA